MLALTYCTPPMGGNRYPACDALPTTAPLKAYRNFFLFLGLYWLGAEFTGQTSHLEEAPLGPSPHRKPKKDKGL